MVPPILPTMFIIPVTTPALRLPTSRQTDQAALPVIIWQNAANAISDAATTRSSVRTTATSAIALVIRPTAPMPQRAIFKLPVRRTSQSVNKPPSQNPAALASQGSAEKSPAYVSEKPRALRRYIGSHVI